MPQLTPPLRSNPWTIIGAGVGILIASLYSVNVVDLNRPHGNLGQQWPARMLFTFARNLGTGRLVIVREMRNGQPRRLPH